MLVSIILISRDAQVSDKAEVTGGHVSLFGQNLAALLIAIASVISCTVIAGAIEVTDEPYFGLNVAASPWNKAPAFTSWTLSVVTEAVLSVPTSTFVAGAIAITLSIGNIVLLFRQNSTPRLIQTSGKHSPMVGPSEAYANEGAATRTESNTMKNVSSIPLASVAGADSEVSHRIACEGNNVTKDLIEHRHGAPATSDLCEVAQKTVHSLSIRPPFATIDARSAALSELEEFAKSFAKMK